MGRSLQCLSVRPSAEYPKLMNDLSHRLCVAPMMDWTDRHCRYFLRLISRRARLYTEMITSAALVHGDLHHHLDFDPAEHPLALQLGGSDRSVLAHGAKLGERWGYDEINLNCGCPSERVQKGSYGACLMAELALVADCVKAMRDAASVAVSGCNVSICHARNAVLKGLSPKENREVPPLRHDVVHRLKRDFPALTIVGNGGITDWDAIERELQNVDGVMLGRVAYHDPWLLAQADARMFADAAPLRSRADVIYALVPYAAREQRRGVLLRAIARHVLGLYHGCPGGRRYRQILSDAAKLRDAGPELFLEALAAVEPVAVAA